MITKEVLIKLCTNAFIAVRKANEQYEFALLHHQQCKDLVAEFYKIKANLPDNNLPKCKEIK